MIDKKVVSNNTDEWNVKNLASGTYYRRIKEGTETTLLKFIKQRGTNASGEFNS